MISIAHSIAEELREEYESLLAEGGTDCPLVQEFGKCLYPRDKK